MAPFFGSCEGRGTSRRMPPVTGSGVPSLLVFGSIDSAAPFLLEEEIYAAGAVRIIEDWRDVVAGLC